MLMIIVNLFVIYILKRKALFLIIKWTLMSMHQLSSISANQEANSSKHMHNANGISSRHREVQIVVHSLFKIFVNDFI